MVTDLHVKKSGQYLQAFRKKVCWLTYMQKNQVNVYKCLEKKRGKLFDRWNLLSPKPVISPKMDGA